MICIYRWVSYGSAHFAALNRCEALAIGLVHDLLTHSVFRQCLVNLSVHGLITDEVDICMCSVGTYSVFANIVLVRSCSVTNALLSGQGLPATFDSPVLWSDEELSRLEGSAWQSMATHVRDETHRQYAALAESLKDSGYGGRLGRKPHSGPVLRLVDRGRLE